MTKDHLNCSAFFGQTLRPSPMVSQLFVEKVVFLLSLLTRLDRNHTVHPGGDSLSSFVRKNRQPFGVDHGLAGMLLLKPTKTHLIENHDDSPIVSAAIGNRSNIQNVFRAEFIRS